MYLKNGELAVLDGDRMRRERKRLGMSQAQLATKIRRSRQRVVMYEGGDAQPDPETMLVIAQELSVTTDELLKLKND